MKNLNNHDLNQNLKNLVTKERALLDKIIEHIAEVDRRKLFLKMAYASLFDYLTREVGYSAGAAQRRIDAARLIQKIPEVRQDIKSGELSLVQISKAQQAFGVAKKTTGQNVSIALQKEILSSLKNKTVDQTNLTLAEKLNLKIETETKRTTQKDESVRLELTLSKEEMALIERARQILSHKTGGALRCSIVQMAKEVIAAQEVKKKSSSQKPASNENPSTKSSFTSTVEPKSVGPRIRRALLNQNKGCEFRDPTTNQACGSKYFLEIDHIKPQYLGGSHQIENLRVLCKNHNIYRYQARLT